MPKIEIDPLFNMVPIVFPRNYFYDVCLENKFHRVVGVAISKSDLENLAIETKYTETSLDDIIGSIRWVVDYTSNVQDAIEQTTNRVKAVLKKAKSMGLRLPF